MIVLIHSHPGRSFLTCTVSFDSADQVPVVYRTAEVGDAEAEKRREKRATDLFNTLFTQQGAEASIDMLKKYLPDACMSCFRLHVVCY